MFLYIFAHSGTKLPYIHDKRNSVLRCVLSVFCSSAIAAGIDRNSAAHAPFRTLSVWGQANRTWAAPSRPWHSLQRVEPKLFCLVLSYLYSANSCKDIARRWHHLLIVGRGVVCAFRHRRRLWGGRHYSLYGEGVPLRNSAWEK